MPMSRDNQRYYYRIYGGTGALERIKVYKREDDQTQGTVTAHVLYNCRRSMNVKTGETIQGEMAADHTTTWHIPRTELERVGINYINSLDRIEQLDGREKGRRWQPESDTSITEKLWALEVHVDCKRCDPPGRLGN